jgi:hypothetical protein
MLLFCACATLSSCGKRNSPASQSAQVVVDPNLQAAFDELRRLQSYTEAGLTSAAYADRLLSSKATIDLALEKTSAHDNAIAQLVQESLSHYLKARDYWDLAELKDKDYEKIFAAVDNELGRDFGADLGSTKSREVLRVCLQRSWARALKAAQVARDAANSSKEVREGILTNSKENIDSASKSFDARLTDWKQERLASIEYRRQAYIRDTKEAEARGKREAEAKAEAARQQMLADEKFHKELETSTKQAEARKREMEARDREMAAAAFRPGGKVYLRLWTSVSHDSGTRGVPAGTQLTILSQPADGSFIVQQGDIQFTIEKGKLTHQWGEQEVEVAAFQPNGRVFVTRDIDVSNVTGYAPSVVPAGSTVTIFQAVGTGQYYVVQYYDALHGEIKFTVQRENLTHRWRR